MPKKEEKPRVYVPERDWNRLLAYCRAAKPNEVIGLAHAEIVDGEIVVSSPVIVEQDVTGATCEFDKKKFVEFIGAYPAIEKVKCVWHSHVDMTARFSSCDRDTSNTLALLGSMVRSGASWWVSIVANCKGEYQCVIDMYKPFEMTVEAEVMTMSETFDDITKEVKEKLKPRWSGGQTQYIGSEHHQGELGYYGYGSRGQGEKSSDVIVRGKSKSGRDPERQYTEDDIFKEISPEGGVVDIGG
jgi:proteasome lid subunit RPN8/RPN11